MFMIRLFCAKSMSIFPKKRSRQKKRAEHFPEGTTFHPVCARGGQLNIAEHTHTLVSNWKSSKSSEPSRRSCGQDGDTPREVLPQFLPKKPKTVSGGNSPNGENGAPPSRLRLDGADALFPYFYQKPEKTLGNITFKMFQATQQANKAYMSLFQGKHHTQLAKKTANHPGASKAYLHVFVILCKLPPERGTDSNFTVRFLCSTQYSG